MGEKPTDSVSWGRRLGNGVIMLLYCGGAGFIAAIAWAAAAFWLGAVMGVVAAACVVIAFGVLYDSFRQLMRDLDAYIGRQLSAAEVSPSPDIVSRMRRRCFYAIYLMVWVWLAGDIAVWTGELWAFLVSVLLASVAAIETSQAAYRWFIHTRFGRWMKAINERAGGSS